MASKGNYEVIKTNEQDIRLRPFCFCSFYVWNVLKHSIILSGSCSKKKMKQHLKSSVSKSSEISTLVAMIKCSLWVTLFPFGFPNWSSTTLTIQLYGEWPFLWKSALACREIANDNIIVYSLNFQINQYISK